MSRIDSPSRDPELQIACWVAETSFRSLRPRLLNWYRAHHRKLPWRAAPKTKPAGSRARSRGPSSDKTTGFSQPTKPNPYHVLVSEFMLQQTQVATVIAYFLRFVARFPTVDRLAKSDEQEVLRLWQGMGYYRRARNLHAAAQQIVHRYGGQVPDDVGALMELPGVGRYTAGAVASIAFGRRIAVLDGNVTRVLTRWSGIDQPPDQPRVRDGLWGLAQHLVPHSAPGDFNQALMELGATTCLPRQPHCGRCPVSGSCFAYREQRVDQLPAIQQRRQPKRVQHHIVAVTRRNRYLFHRRPGRGLWANMWQLPTVEQTHTTRGSGVTSQSISSQFGLIAAEPQKIGGFQHQTTHRRILFTVWHSCVEGGRLRARSGVWRKLDDLDDLPLANPQRRAIAILNSLE